VVTSNRQSGTLMIIARPNHSSSWRANLYALIAISVPSLGAAIGFTLLGAWPILPFAGLELLALATALYYVNWKLQYRHVITLSDDSVQIEKGHYHPKQCWRFARQRTGLSITPEQHPWDSPELAVHDSNESVGIGEFLSPADARELISLLRGELRVDSASPREGRNF
jgi:uncharacterized membrane protein